MLFVENEVIAGGGTMNHGIRCSGALGHPGNPHDNEFLRNVIRNPKTWAIYNPESARSNVYRDNTFYGTDKIHSYASEIRPMNTFR